MAVYEAEGYATMGRGQLAAAQGFAFYILPRIAIAAEVTVISAFALVTLAQYDVIRLVGPDDTRGHGLDDVELRCF